MKSIEAKPITKLSLFVIEKFLLTNVALKLVKTKFNNMLIMKVAKNDYPPNLKIKAYPHRFFNTYRGVVRSLELAVYMLEEIKINLKDRKV